MGLLSGTEQLTRTIVLVVVEAAMEQHQPQPGVESAY
jgi:hypothetical protein